ncbi:hypothetical protein Syun_029551 [Stephania yunnanensis]|uniref:Uncharacterized protein n=1 Tax=Stephania yunnanensis TaxID=152371 RepID=A0AAP0E960_9MAGN
MTFIDTRSERFYDRLQRRRLELTLATPDQSVDEEAVYLNVASECPKGRVYGLGSLGRKKRRYAYPGASTSQMPDMVPRSEFNVVAEQLRKRDPIGRFGSSIEWELVPLIAHIPVTIPAIIRFPRIYHESATEPETEFFISVSDPLLIRDGSETECKNSISDSVSNQKRNQRRNS